VELEEHRAQRLASGRAASKRTIQTSASRMKGSPLLLIRRAAWRRDDHRQLGADRLLVVLELAEPRRLQALVCFASR